MTASIVHHPTAAQTEYYRGFDLRVAEVFRGVPVDLSTLTRHERRGYEAACRAEADADTDQYISRQAELAARQREIDAAQDSAAAAGWPSSAWW